MYFDIFAILFVKNIVCYSISTEDVQYNLPVIFL